MKLKMILLSSVYLLSGAGLANANDDACVGKVPTLNVIGQGMPSVTELDKYVGEFNDKWKTTVKINLLGENERRAKARLDASTGAGAYQVLYVDEANTPEYASAGWLYPLAEVLPEEYDIADFRVDLANVASYEGKQYFAPLVGGGDILIYRKDVLEKAGLSVPKTLDELVAGVKAVNDPANKLYGWAARGQRGSGMNVWRWTPFFRGLGGQWLDGDQPAFNSEIGVKATELYMDLLKSAPPGVGTFSWSDAVEAFRGGQVVYLIESDVFGPWMEVPDKSVVAGKVGYAPPPEPLGSAGWAHGFAVSAVGAKDECTRKVAADFVGWATSKDMEARRLSDGIASDLGRQSSLKSEAFSKAVPKEYIDALLATGSRTQLLIMASPAWPEIGDNLGLALEELFTGTKTDVQATLDEAAFTAEDALRRVK
ncbi:sugar ABC transporter substrate-binding protein [Brucella sp. TWI432]